MIIRTASESVQAYAAWRKAWLKWHASAAPRRRQWPEPVPNLGDSYVVIYDTPDEQGYWGRRLEMQLFAVADTVQEEKAAHDEVRARFVAEMGDRPFEIYRVMYE